jgi:ATP-dependent Clp protease adaptor protein ClpS
MTIMIGGLKTARDGVNYSLHLSCFLRKQSCSPMATKQPGKPDGGKKQGDTALQEKPVQTKPPPMWQVVMYNDDYTPMEFVIDVLEQFFGHTHERATQIMLKVHTEGRGICGIFPRDVATMKVEQVGDYARQHQHPLRCGMEEV